MLSLYLHSPIPCMIASFCGSIQKFPVRLEGYAICSVWVTEYRISCTSLNYESGSKASCIPIIGQFCLPRLCLDDTKTIGLSYLGYATMEITDDCVSPRQLFMYNIL